MVISIYLANIAILTDAGMYQSFRMIDTQDSLKFEPWKLVYVYIYIILFWSRTWWTRLERRESMKREHKKVWQSVSLREREKRGEVGRSYIWYLCGLFCLFYCICMCTQIQHYSCLFGTMSKTPHLFKLYISGCKITSFVLLWLCALQNWIKGLK